MRRVAFLVEELGRSGGMAVVRGHARHLREREGVDAQLVVCGRRPGRLPAAQDGVPVRRLADIGQADVAVATWWTTAEALWELEAHRRVVFVQSIEARFYGPEATADRLGAMGVLDLPVDYVVIASHMRELLRTLRPDARVHQVPNGIDKAVFREAPPREWDGTLRVLVEGQPTLWFKAVQEGIAAVRLMRAPATVTVVAHEPPSRLGADRVVSGLSPADMAALFAEHDVLLKLSRVEGLPLPPLEAAHVGVPSVLTPFTGREDWSQDEVNGLVVGFDDEPGTVAALERLAADAELRSRLRAGALRTAADWPDAAASSSAFAAALRGIVAEAPASPDRALRRLARSRRLAIELAHSAGDAAKWQEAYREADARNAEYDAWTRELRRRIDALQARPGFRIEQKLRRVARWAR